ncbi:MAG: CRISPR-associated endoribonuclease Cas6 [Candidatus Odinarchaeota archaeon]
MRLLIRLQQVNQAYIPFNRKYGLMTWIYSCLREIDSNYASELHSSKKIKYFVFSDLFIPYPYRVDRARGIKKMNERDPYLFFSSPDEMLLEKLLGGIIASPDTSHFRLGPAEFTVKTVRMIKQPRMREEEVMLPLSPVVTTTWREKKIWYLNPSEGKFLVNIKQNLEKKVAKVTYQSDIPPFTLELAPGYQREGKVSYSLEFKATRITAFKIPFRLKGPAEVIQVAYDCGLGERNSQGFGMIDLYREKDGV